MQMNNLFYPTFVWCDTVIDVQKPKPIILRYTVTVGGSTWTIGYLSKRGIMKTDQIKDELQERSDQIKVISSTLCSQHCVIVFILDISFYHILTTYSNSFQKQGVRMANKLTWENLKKQRRKPWQYHSNFIIWLWYVILKNIEIE